MASAAGLLTQLGAAGYSVTKHAAVGFAEWLSITYGDNGIGVSCVCPMGVDTPLLKGIVDSANPEARVATGAVTTAGKVIGPDLVAELVVDAVRANTFLVLPHPEVLDMYRQKGADYERWLSGMRRFQRSLHAVDGANTPGKAALMQADPRGLRSDAPLLDAWLRFQESPPTPFTIPGHKQRHDLVGDIIASDVPLFGGLDTMKLSRGVLVGAEARAARLWGARRVPLLGWGATHANQALALASPVLDAPGSERLRSCRQPHPAPLAASLAWSSRGSSPGPGPAADGRVHRPPARRPLAAVAGRPRRNPEAGPCSSATRCTWARSATSAHARAAHEHRIPLVVDAAWGAHFGFHPGRRRRPRARRRRDRHERPQDAPRVLAGRAVLA